MRSSVRGTTHHHAWHSRRVDMQHLAARWFGQLAGTATAFALLVGAAGPAAAESCAPPSYKTARAAFGCEYIRLLRVQRNGDTPDFSRCEQQLEKKMTRAGLRFDACPAPIELQGDIDACVADAHALIDPGTNPVCRVRYYGQARAFSRCGIGEIIKGLRNGGSVDFDRCQTRLGRVLDRTQARLDGCPEVANPVFEAALLDCLASLASTIENAPTPTATATATETEIPVDTPTPTATLAPTDTPTAGPTDTPTEVPTDTPAPTETATEVPTDTPAPTDTPTELPTDTPVPTSTPTIAPTDTPVPPPTDTPTEVPTDTPAPTDTPTEIPTHTPTPLPTFTPTSTPTEVPTVPQSYRVVFVTSTTTTGSFSGGVEGADSFCQARANAAGLQGRFVAWLSGGTLDTQAQDRIENALSPYRLVNGTKVADDFADLTDGSLDNAINRDENGTSRTGTGNVWTGTAEDGTGVTGIDNNTRCEQWQSSASNRSGRVGSSSASNGDWTNTGTNDGCDVANRLYCVQSNDRTVFVTSTTHDGSFVNGARGADDVCQARANAAGLDGMYIAWLSEGTVDTQARDRIFQAATAYRLVNGTKVADNWDDLSDGSLDHAIDRDENGTLRSGTDNVWTGTANNGSGVAGTSPNTRCDGWTSDSSGHGGRVGSSSASNGDWTNTGNDAACNQNNRFYCIESVPACGVESKCIFRTRELHSADLGGLAGADAICQAAAEASSLVTQGTYRAWLSTASTSAASRLTHATVPYIQVNGQKVADNWNDLTNGDLEAAICKSQFQANVPSTACSDIGDPIFRAWTATDTSGTFAGPGSCNEWTSNSGGSSAQTGNITHFASAGWTDQGDDTCAATDVALYCLQQ